MDLVLPGLHLAAELYGRRAPSLGHAATPMTDLHWVPVEPAADMASLEAQAQEFAHGVDAFMLRYDRPDGGVNVAMQTDDMRGVAGHADTREAAFEKLLIAARDFNWTAPEA